MGREIKSNKKDEEALWKDELRDSLQSWELSEQSRKREHIHSVTGPSGVNRNWTQAQKPRTETAFNNIVLVRLRLWKCGKDKSNET